MEGSTQQPRLLPEKAEDKGQKQCSLQGRGEVFFEQK
jgi:hypothetical protein